MNRHALLFPLALACATAPSLPAQTWIESGDAGELPVTASVSSGTGPLVQINGSLASSTDVDLYLVWVDDPATFSCSSVGGANLDTQLWMFHTDGTGIAFRDDNPGTLQSTLTGQFLSSPGHVLLGISRFDHDALDASGQQLWLDQPYTTERQPDGPGSGPVTQWAGAIGTLGGNYSLFLSGASYAEQPTTAPLYAWALVEPSLFPGQATFTPRLPFQETPSGELITVDRVSTGLFAVRLPGQIPQTGAFHVSPVGGNHAVVIRNWNITAGKLTCWVNVFDNGGTLQEGDFSIQYRYGGAPTDRAAYLWADLPTTPQYTISHNYVFNGNRPTPSITRYSAGLYRVRLPELGANFSGGTFCVSAYNFFSQAFVRAKIDSWGIPTGTTHLDVFVRCFDVNGVEADSYFVLSYHEAPGPIAPQHGSGSYLWANQPTTSRRYRAPLGYSRSNGPLGPLNSQTITRVATGVYEVEMPSVAPSLSSLATVVSRGSDNTYATIRSWGPQGTGTRVVVDTFDASGAPADSEFLLNYVTDDPAAGAATNRVVGRGCGSVVLSGRTRPVLGSSWELGLSATPGAQLGPPGLLLDIVPGLRIPIDPLNAPGCEFYAIGLNAPAVWQVPAASFSIPNQGILLGNTVFVQAIAIEPTANPLGVVTSNAIAGTLGID